MLVMWTLVMSAPAIRLSRSFSSYRSCMSFAIALWFHLKDMSTLSIGMPSFSEKILACLSAPRRNECDAQSASSVYSCCVMLSCGSPAALALR